MKKANILTIVFLVCLFCSGPIFAQKGKPAVSEQKGKENLERFAATYNSRATWEKRASQIRQNILEGLQLSPLPAKTALKPIIRNRKVMDGYAVESVAFESKPGFWVTGNLYTPLKIKGKIPGILCPTGHSYHPEVARADANWQTLCASLARMGAVVLAYDMIGYSESNQCIHHLPIAAKVQTWDSMRAIDFLLTLKNVDPKRIAVTGYSGGGTQTFLVSAVDSRVAVSAPVTMVSAYFYGGCVCESGMPIHSGHGIETNNVEIAALMAPKPLIVVGDGHDWSKNTPQVVYPYIKNVYDLYGAGNQVEYAYFPEEGHDYGISKRKAVYAFFAKHLGLNINNIKKGDAVDESFVTVQQYNDLTVFDLSHPRPAYAVMGDDKVTALFGQSK